MSRQVQRYNDSCISYKQQQSHKDIQPERLGDSHIWLFPGAEADELKEMWAAESEDGADEDVEKDERNQKRSAEFPIEKAQKVARVDE